MYTYTMDLNTSFTGDDNLYVRLRTGNGKVTAVTLPLPVLKRTYKLSSPVKLVFKSIVYVYMV